MTQKNKIGGGYTMWARQVFDSEIFFYKPDKWFKIWFFIVGRVNHKDGKLFKRGSALITYEEIMQKTKASKPQVHKCIKYLEKENMLGFRRTTRGMVRIVLNYDKYQASKNYGDNSKTTREITSGQLADNSKVLPIGEECNNERMKEVSLEHVSTKKEEGVISSKNNLPTSPVVSSSLPPAPPKYQPPSERKQMKGKDGRVLSVWLCREEYEILWKMCDDDETLLDYYINQLHDFAVANNRSYTSHFHELRTWIRRDKKNS